MRAIIAAAALAAVASFSTVATAPVTDAAGHSDRLIDPRTCC